MINPDQFYKYILKPVNAKLASIAMSSYSMEGFDSLILGILQQESRLTYIDQIERGGDNKPGPAYGLGQMEALTHDDTWQNFLIYRPKLAEVVKSFCIGKPSAEQLHGNLYYACAMTSVYMMRRRLFPNSFFPIPQPGDYKTMAQYWKKYYNTASGAGIEQSAEETFKLACATVRKLSS